MVSRDLAIETKVPVDQKGKKIVHQGENVAKKSKFATVSGLTLMSRRVEGLFDQGGTMVEASRLMGITSLYVSQMGKERR